ncbi:MAG: hypothetical protein GSR84_02155 [Desulfurococcales archaeon]|nr:hypothetical protein [Desulfurococcales archaeon]
MDVATLAWRMLRSLPPLYAWRLLHSARAEVLDEAARVLGRPPAPGGLSRTFLGYTLEHPVGIAAGLDKDASMVWLAWSMGAGFHVVGSVLPHPYEGVEPKILVRLPSGGTVNRLGLPSKGPRVAYERLRVHKPPGMPIAVNIASFTAKGYGELYRLFSGVASWVEINISCPNVEDHRTFEDPDMVREICRYMKPLRAPALLKIPPTRDESVLARYLEASLDCGFSGIVAGNTMRIMYNGVPAGLGGPSLFETTLFMVRRLRSLAPRGFALVGVGGVDSGYRAKTLLDAGADLVEVMSAVIHRGPFAPWLVARELSQLL